MRWFFRYPILGLLYGQVTLLQSTDSLTAYIKPNDALALYDSVLRQLGLSDSLRLRAYIGSLRPLIGLRRWNDIQARVDTIMRLTQAIKDSIGYAEALSALGEALARQCKYDTAEKVLQQAYGLFQTHGFAKASFGLLLNRIGMLRYWQGKYEEAEQSYKEALSIQARTLGTDHPDYAWTLNNLAIVYRSRGRYTEAEQLYLRAKEIRARTVGVDHPDYAITLNNLSVLYRAQGRYKEAEKTDLEVKEIRARVLGTDHPDYAATLDNPANVYYDQGRYAEAEQLYSEARAIRARTLGTDHPDYINTLNNLANIHYARGQYAEAEKLYVFRSQGELRTHSGY